MFDRSIWNDVPELIDEEKQRCPSFAVTQNAGIIPFSYNDFKELNPRFRVNSSAWGALIKFSGWEKLLTSLHGDLINRLDNCITMQANVHDVFRRLGGWLDELPVC